MARSKSQPLIIGIGSHVVCLNGDTGDELWRTKLKSASIVTIRQEGARVLAGASGELFCLDAKTGSILWHNKLKGLGLGYVTFSGGTDGATIAAAQAQQAAAVAAAT
jgi:outer membrane protein assembly factor BamB